MQKDKNLTLDLINETIIRVDSVYNEWAKRYDLTFNSLIVIHTINKNWFMTQSQLCDKLELSKTTINSILKRFIEKGWVTLIGHEKNKKSKNINITKMGQNIFSEIINDYYLLQNDLISDFEINDIEKLHKLLEVFNKNLRFAVKNK
ncbi:MAG: MarR family winged helix-turn-helix transcriptional regulator [Mycoplasma sp.]